MVFEYRRDGAVAVIALAHPPVNALNLALRRALFDFFLAMRSDASVDAVIVHGAGAGFCAGGDRTESGTPDASERPTLSRDVLDAIERCGKPVIAALHGFAMGGGLELALACAARVAVAGTRVALPEVTIGVFPLSATQRLPRVIGVARAAGFMLAGASVSASDPAIAGCFERIVMSEDGLLQAAVQFAHACIAAPPVPLRARPIPGDPVSRAAVGGRAPWRGRTLPGAASVAAGRARRRRSHQFPGGPRPCSATVRRARWHAAFIAADWLSATWNWARGCSSARAAK